MTGNPTFKISFLLGMYDKKHTALSVAIISCTGRTTFLSKTSSTATCIRPPFSLLSPPSRVPAGISSFDFFVCPDVVSLQLRMFQHPRPCQAEANRRRAGAHARGGRKKAGGHAKPPHVKNLIAVNTFRRLWCCLLSRWAQPVACCRRDASMCIFRCQFSLHSAFDHSFCCKMELAIATKENFVDGVPIVLGAAG